jgi:glycogen phosphorylase
MNELSEVRSSRSTRSKVIPNLLRQYGCGPIQFSGTNDALYERHLLFDDIVAPTAAGAREQFEAAARSARDILSQRWVQTDSTYDRENPKRVYYLSMEFLTGRSLSNNVTNLLLDPYVKRAASQKEPRLARPH